MSKRSTTAQSAALALLASLFTAAAPRASQAEPEVARVADALVAEALEANLALAATEAGVAQREAALDEARARFLPELDLQLRYTRADGGRVIDIPALGLEFELLREREQDSVLRLAQPLRVSSAQEVEVTSVGRGFASPEPAGSPRRIRERGTGPGMPGPYD